VRILVDFTQIPLRRAGAGVYAENLVRRLPSFLGADDLLFLLLQKDEVTLPRLLADRKNVHLLFVPSRVIRNRLILMLYEQLVLPWLLLIHKIDVLHTLHYTIPLWAPSARVVTFHDLTVLLWPQMHTRGRRVIMPLYIRSAWRLADVILFVSAATRRDAERLLPVFETRLNRVVPLGVNLDALSRPAQAELRSGLDSLQINKPYVLFVGTIEPRKNLVRLIHAFEDIAAQFPEHILILAGKLGWGFDPVLEAVASSPIRKRIRHLGYISDESKRVLLGGCELLVYPSLYEGFGLPVLEAMAAGIPLITSNVSSLPEVVGAAALLVDPESVDQIAAAMALLLGDRDLANKYGALGQERARMFSWENTAAETYKAYQAAYKRGRRDTAEEPQQAPPKVELNTCDESVEPTSRPRLAKSAPL
jgi:glycosyltransferase involved in cell wall biosynthesis